MNTKQEYAMAFRAMRKWWKDVDTGSLNPKTRERYKNICASYNSSILMNAMDSILARRKAEYFAQNPEHERAERRWKVQRWLSAYTSAQEPGLPY